MVSLLLLYLGNLNFEKFLIYLIQPVKFSIALLISELPQAAVTTIENFVDSEKKFNFALS